MTGAFSHLLPLTYLENTDSIIWPDTNPKLFKNALQVGNYSADAIVMEWTVLVHNRSITEAYVMHRSLL